MQQDYQQSPTPTSVDNVKQATPNFILTQDYIEAERTVETKLTTILHIHGFPGTGKSEIARRLASKFPFTEAQVYVKWHIECYDSGHDVVQQLTGILKDLKEHSFLISGSQKRISDELAKGRAKPFVDLLRSVNVPVLIIIEDPQRSDYSVLRDLLTAVNVLCHRTDGGRFHVYITSRKNAVAMPSYDLLDGLKCYTHLKVDGFSDNEGLQLLLGSKTDISNTEREAALQIIKRNSGSPLGLIAVKANCRKSHITYEEYLELAEDEKMEVEVQEMEASQLKEEYGDNFRHLFLSVVRLLKPKEEDDAIYHDIWQVMATLCFLHHGEVPQQLVGKITQGLPNRAGENGIMQIFKRNTSVSGNVITHLEDYGICKIDGRGYTGTSISFHEVIFRAVRVMLKSDSGGDAYANKLQSALFALSAIVHKDLRKTADNVFMTKVAPQIQTGLRHAQEQFRLENLESITPENFTLWMCVCHLGEVIGIVKSLGVLSLKKYAESCLELAAQVVLKTVGALTGSTLNPNILQPGSDVDETANVIASSCVEAGKKMFDSMPEDVLDRYLAVVLQMKPPELDFLQKHASDDEALSTLKLATEKFVGLNKHMMEDLRKHTEIFLNRELHCAVFFSERLASILHTWGRVLLYYNIPIDAEMRRRYTWYSKLANAISRRCHELTGVHILFERLTSISLQPIMLKGLSQCTPEERKATLLESHASLTEMLSGSQGGVAFYEHGHIKEMDGAVYTQMILYRFLIRVNTKLLAIQGFSSREGFVEKADQDYLEMYKLSTENISWIMAPKCLVYCGKYQACKGNYQLAVKCFCEAIKAGIKQSNNLFAWACYNYARAVACGRIEEHKEPALAKCREALKNEDDTDRDLVEYITDCMRRLSEM